MSDRGKPGEKGGASGGKPSAAPRPPAAGGGAKLLLSRLRALMANQAQDPKRLDRVVELIGNTMVADVCSIYLQAEDASLLLMATKGLRPEAVGRTRLKQNEGLVGLVSATARPLKLTDAFSHPRFSYRPETGEDPFHSFMGVPILRGGRVLGVLVVQNRTERVYDEEEGEALQTIAMVLAELVAAAADTLSAGLRQTRPVELRGRTLNEGLAQGRVFLYDPVVPPTQLFAADAEVEERRLNNALEALRASIDAMLTRAGPVLFGESRDVLETYRLFAHDPSWEARLVEAVRTGLSAEAAVDRVRREHRARLESARDSLLRERLHDLEDLENRLLRQLAGDNGSGREAPPGSVLVASRIGPAELLEYRDADLAAIVLEEAGAGSHAAIVARAIGVPAIGGLTGLVTRAEDGDIMIVDGEAGLVHIRPEVEIIANFQARVALADQKQAELSLLRDKAAISTDGVEIDLFINAGLSFDLDHLDEVGAKGVGLFRTEFQFMASETMPGLDEQATFYKSVIDRAGNRPVVFRTIDLGGDKIAPFMGRREREENPALGWRALRMALDHPYFFRRQLRALIRASRNRSLRLMFPMVATVEEFEAARRLLDSEMEWAVKFGRDLPDKLYVGAMVETPSLAFSIDSLKGKADFLSVGTNDLMQFFFAADRDNARLTGRYDILSRPALRLLQKMQQRAEEAELPITVCGEAAGRPLEALTLVALGYRRLSMQASRIAPIKLLVRSVDVSVLAQHVHKSMNTGDESIRNAMLSIAQDFGVKI
ncbi:MAG: phosphoenolpyruvate--protein phosphotransferase [Hyphomonadaceae bacterium]|nr:phosphoenolpyruvate--protein phosphotransferase [Hyphomonadaceae bacterium]